MRQRFVFSGTRGDHVESTVISVFMVIGVRLNGIDTLQLIGREIVDDRFSVSRVPTHTFNLVEKEHTYSYRGKID